MVAVNYDWDEIEDNIDEEYDDSGNTVAEYTTEPYVYGDLISQRREGESRHFCFDGQGSTLAQTDSVGNVTDTFAYTSFGEVTERTGTTVTPYQYVGKRGYYLLVAQSATCVRYRIYLPLIGRWTSADPLLRVMPDVRHPSTRLALLPPYQYCNNRSPTLIDASGLASAICECFDASRGVVQSKLISGPLGYLLRICEYECAKRHDISTPRLKDILKWNPLPSRWDDYWNLCDATLLTKCGCSAGDCVDYLLTVLAGMTKATRETGRWRGTWYTSLCNRFISNDDYKILDQCHTWKNICADWIGFLPGDPKVKSACLEIREYQFYFNMPPAKWASHSFQILKSTCTGKCLVIDNLGPPRDPCALVLPPGAGGMTDLNKESLQRWNSILSACCPGMVVGPSFGY